MNKDIKKEKEFNSFVATSGLIWGPSPEIYGGTAGFYTYGPLGKLLKNKVENSVRKTFNSQGFREIETPTVITDLVWKASGHLDTFRDRTIKCSKCKSIFRADKLIEENFDVPADSFTDKHILNFIKEHKIVCPSCGGELDNDIESQSLMMKTKVSGEDFSLRPETATATYLTFPRLLEYFRNTLPFGVFQIGKAYRNEISPRQSVLRGREFTQAEGQVFIDPEDKNKWEKYNDIKNELLPLWDYHCQEEEKGVEMISVKEALDKKMIKSQAYGWAIWLAYNQFVNLGISKERIRLRQHHPNEKAFYADDAWDVEIKLNNYGWTEVCGVHDRTNYDLTQHSKSSNVSLTALRENGEKFTPHILEIAFGTDRPTYALIDLFYEKKSEEEGKTIFRVPYHMAPIEVAVLPLVKKEELVKLSEKIKDALKKKFIVEYDEKGSIGKRYLRCALKGIPYAITIDQESLKDKSVTIRDRDSENQIRVKIDLLKEELEKLFSDNIHSKFHLSDSR